MRILRGTVLAGLASAAAWLLVMFFGYAASGRPIAEVFTPIAKTFRDSVALDGRASASTVLIALAVVVVIALLFSAALEVFASNRTPGSAPWLVLGGAIFGGVFWIFAHMIAWRAGSPEPAAHLVQGWSWFASVVAGAVSALCLLPARLPEERFFTIDPPSGPGKPTGTPIPH
ncbi:hypothetical protein [Longispora albida]|uniref:hypothetical protein n=1 Tax=Longispora albida TaxID=203523 RepID=UPI00037391A5|nr:hypothetical protein [Longispora albida]